MRNRNKTSQLKRTASHRRSLLANMACSLIEHGAIRTTLGKAKALRPVAEKMVTLGKKGDIHSRRQAVAFLRHKDVVKQLFEVVAPASADRQGGYCRITKLGPRPTDAAPMAIIEFVDRVVEEDEEVVEDTTDDAVEVEAEKAEAKAE
ncbi:50S ribosomal protein L17 [Haloferula sp.]|uniref:50S ribosomal protein L17 n=1 Tax=Haloferula sp. TaxID=2497595 RepID=UPI00329EDC46